MPWIFWRDTYDISSGEYAYSMHVFVFCNSLIKLGSVENLQFDGFEKREHILILLGKEYTCEMNKSGSKAGKRNPQTQGIPYS
jgi:hypothetical protein